MSAPIGLALLLLAAPIVYLWLQRPPARALRVSSLLLARALGGAARSRAAPSWLTLLQLALVLGALLSITAALVGPDRGADRSLVLLRLAGSTGAAPAGSAGATGLWELRLARPEGPGGPGGPGGLVERARGEPAVEAVFGEAADAGDAAAPPGEGGAPDFAADTLTAQIAAERAVAALAARCVAAPDSLYRGLDGPTVAAVEAAGCPTAPGPGSIAPPAPLQVALGRPTGPLGELELAVAVAGDQAHAVEIAGPGLAPTTATLGGRDEAGALGWSMLRLDMALDATELQLGADGGPPRRLRAPPTGAIRVSLWTAAPEGPVARALRAYPRVRLSTFGPGEISDQDADLIVLAVAPGLPLPPSPVRASLGADPAPLGGAWRTAAPARGALRVAERSSLLNYTAAGTAEGAAVPDLRADGRPTLVLAPQDRALWLSQSGPILAEREEPGGLTAFLTIAPDEVSPAERVPLLHLLGNLVDRAAGADQTASLAPDAAQPWAQAFPSPGARPEDAGADGPAGSALLQGLGARPLITLAFALLLAQGLVGRLAGGRSA